MTPLRASIYTSSLILLVISLFITVVSIYLLTRSQDIKDEVTNGTNTNWAAIILNACSQGVLAIISLIGVVAFVLRQPKAAFTFSIMVFVFVGLALITFIYTAVSLFSFNCESNLLGTVVSCQGFTTSIKGVWVALLCLELVLLIYIAAVVKRGIREMAEEQESPNSKNILTGNKAT